MSNAAGPTTDPGARPLTAAEKRTYNNSRATWLKDQQFRYPLHRLGQQTLFLLGRDHDPARALTPEVQRAKRRARTTGGIFFVLLCGGLLLLTGTVIALLWQSSHWPTFAAAVIVAVAAVAAAIKVDSVAAGHRLTAHDLTQPRSTELPMGLTSAHGDLTDALARLRTTSPHPEVLHATAACETYVRDLIRYASSSDLTTYTAADDDPIWDVIAQRHIDVAARLYPLTAEATAAAAVAEQRLDLQAAATSLTTSPAPPGAPGAVPELPPAADLASIAHLVAPPPA